jgi:transcriptional regulator with XRE-family HTH domain
MSSKGCPASVPIRVQQKCSGSKIVISVNPDYAVLFINMQRDSTAISQVLESLKNNRIESQSEIAKKAGISQSTVSRRLRKPPRRHSNATSKLCNYAVRNVLIAPDPEMKKGVQRAFDEVWEKSGAHAAAISKVIEAFAELCRSEREDKERSA